MLGEPEISKYPLLDRYRPLLEPLSQGNHEHSTTLVKYETMVTDFALWLQPVLSALLIDSEDAANEAFCRFINLRYKNEFVADKSDSGQSPKRETRRS